MFEKGKLILLIKRGRDSVCLIGIMLISIVTISEIEQRHKVLGLTEKKIATLKSDYIETRKLSVSDSDEVEAQAIEDRIIRAEQIHSKIESLIVSGTNLDNRTLEYLKSEDERENIRNFDNYVPWYNRLAFFHYLNSDTLLAVVVIICAAIGSVIRGMREEGVIKFNRFLVGLTSGFIAFFALKGGKYIFLIEPNNTGGAFNPYNSAFIGLLAGLFAEKLFQILKDKTDQSVEALIGK